MPNFRKKHLYILTKCSVNIEQKKWFAVSPSACAQKIKKIIFSSQSMAKKILFTLVNKQKKEYDYEFDKKKKSSKGGTIRYRLIHLPKEPQFEQFILQNMKLFHIGKIPQGLDYLIEHPDLINYKDLVENPDPRAFQLLQHTGQYDVIFDNLFEFYDNKKNHISFLKLMSTCKNGEMVNIIKNALITRPNPVIIASHLDYQNMIQNEESIDLMLYVMKNARPLILDKILCDFKAIQKMLIKWKYIKHQKIFLLYKALYNYYHKEAHDDLMTNLPNYFLQIHEHSHEYIERRFHARYFISLYKNLPEPFIPPKKKEYFIKLLQDFMCASEYAIHFIIENNIPINYDFLLQNPSEIAYNIVNDNQKRLDKKTMESLHFSILNDDQNFFFSFLEKRIASWRLLIAFVVDSLNTAKPDYYYINVKHLLDKFTNEYTQIIAKEEDIYADLDGFFHLSFKKYIGNQFLHLILQYKLMNLDIDDQIKFLESPAVEKYYEVSLSYINLKERLETNVYNFHLVDWPKVLKLTKSPHLFRYYFSKERQHKSSIVNLMEPQDIFSIPEMIFEQDVPSNIVERLKSRESSYSSSTRSITARTGKTGRPETLSSLKNKLTPSLSSISKKSESISSLSNLPKRLK